MQPSTAVTLVAALLWGAGCAPYPGADVPFPVTPPGIVERMLRLAKVGPADIVSDLGSGDGRLVIAAVRDFRARAATGIEIDPALVARSREYARRAGVANRAGPTSGQRAFDMGDWEPQAMVQVDANGRAAPVYLWVVPER